MNPLKKRWIFGEWVDTPATLDVETCQTILAKAQDRRNQLREIPLDLTLDVLGRVGKLWADPQSSYRQNAQKTLPNLTGFSPRMIELGLGELGEMLNPRSLQTKIQTELRKIPVGLGYQWDSQSNRYLQYQPLGTLLHVLSGNVFLVGPGSWLEGILTQNINILKLSSAETAFMPSFIDSVRECDPEGLLAPYVALIDFPSSEREVLQVFQKGVDGVVVWGGEEAVRAYREGLPSRTRLIQFGPKFSVGVVTHKGMQREPVDKLADKIARELSIWDQNACTAPQVCFVEGRKNAEDLCRALGPALQSAEKSLPSGEASTDTAVEIRKWRGIAEIAEARGEALLIDSGLHSIDWTVCMDGVRPLENSPLHRTLRVFPYEQWDQVYDSLEPFQGYLQTVGLSADRDEFFEISRALSPLGALRFLELGEMSGGAIDDPHDGQYDLPQLLNLCFLRPSPNVAPSWEVLGPPERRQVQDRKLREVLRSAREIPFYEERLLGISVRGVSDLTKVPLLDRAVWEAGLPLGKSQGGYVTRSGGSTGTPKFSYFDQDDWQTMVDAAVRIFRACGFTPQDRVANFMLAGDLYGSFISFNHVNCALGVQSFCFGHAQDPAAFLDIARQFQINALQGVPLALVALMRKCREIDPSFTVEKIMFAGQPMSPSDARWLKDEVGVKQIASVIGTTEANQVGYQCEHLEGSFHHLAEDYNYFEVLDEDGNLCLPGELGRLVVTCLEKKNNPVIRYQIGDAVRVLPEICRCGRLDRVVDYRGRWDDLLSIGKMNFKLSDIQNVLSALPVSGIQVVGSYTTNSEKITLRLETSGLTSSPEAETLRHQTLALLRSEVPSFAEFQDLKLFEFEIAVMNPGELARNPRTGKIKGVIDERQHFDSPK